MTKSAQSRCYKLKERKALFDELGGLSSTDTSVKNSEWLYTLQRETRNSVSIEGYFATEKELEAVLGGRKRAPEIFNYFRTAQFYYDLALQYYREGTLSLDVPLIRQIHSSLFLGLTERRGLFRTGPIHINKAKMKPPDFNVGDYIRSFIGLTESYMSKLPLLPALARIHTLFESIHPFADGNGRAGRILLNYLAVSHGYPPIVIKGLAEDERSRYYHALETADLGFHNGFPKAQPQALRQQLEQGEFDKLEDILCEGLTPQLDILIAALFEKKREPLVELYELAPHFKVKNVTLRQWVSRGKLIATKRRGKLYSHPELFLG